MTKKELQSALSHVADMCLEAKGPSDYDDEDLSNAALVFTYFFMDHIWQTNQEMTQEGREKIALATGTAIRELIRSATGKDMHVIIKRIYKE